MARTRLDLRIDVPPLDDTASEMKLRRRHRSVIMKVEPAFNFDCGLA
jgi:hypothetical protein